MLCGTLAGTESFVQIGHGAKRKIADLRQPLAFAHGVPAYDTLNDVINALPALFSQLFIERNSSLRDGDPEIIDFDGKTSRRVRCGEKPPLHLLPGPGLPSAAGAGSGGGRRHARVHRARPGQYGNHQTGRT